MRQIPGVLLLLCLGGPLATMAQEPQGQEGRWPSLERQLAADRVVVGSPLERLIEENQDTSPLRPAEADDLIPVPLWLRVLWRKDHPGPASAADDPMGGYPHLLKEIHEWLLSHQDLRPGLPQMAQAPRSKAAAPADLRISGASLSPRSESDIRINPWNPNRIVAASNNIDLSGQQAQYWSIDGGRTWGQSFLPLLPHDSFQTDPTVDWTSDGTAWSTTIGVALFGSELRLRLYKSTDSGATWTFDSTISGAQSATDKQMAWIDHSATSPYKDSMYATWHNDEPVYVNFKRPGGAWGTPLRVSGAETTGTGIGGDVKTNSAGHVFVLWPDTGSRGIYLAKSTDGGASFSRPVKVAATFDGYDIGVPAQNNRRALIYVSAGAWRAAGKDLVYAAWTDLSGATGCTTATHEPRGNAASACKSRIWFARSTDGGATWSARKMLNNQAGKNDQLNQALVVDEATGRVAIAYYDTVGDPARKKTNIWYQSSSDDGVTWSVPFKVTTAPSDETGAGADDGNQYGDYMGLTGHAGTFFPAWTDRRTSGPEEIWTAALVDNAPACTTKTLFQDGFETAKGLAGWARGSFLPQSSALDWRGVQACPAKAGGKVFRFGGGAGCQSDYGNNRFVYTQPGGAAGIAVPAGASKVRLSFWHRHRFAAADGGTVAVSLDGARYQLLPNGAILSGAGFNGTAGGGCTPAGAQGARIFTGVRSSFVNTVIDLDAACNLITGTTNGCAGRSVRIAFAAVTDCQKTDDGWSLDEMAVTACVP